MAECSTGICMWDVLQEPGMYPPRALEEHSQLVRSAQGVKRVSCSSSSLEREVGEGRAGVWAEPGVGIAELQPSALSGEQGRTT